MTLSPPDARGLRVPLFEPAAMSAALSCELEAAMARVLRDGHYILGPHVASFENAFAKYVGTTHAVGVGSGTDALVLALRALRIGSGDEVVTVANAGIPPIAAIRAVGAVPLFADVDPATLLLDLAMADSLVTTRTRAVLAVHLYGQPIRGEALRRLADRHSLALIEDASHAHGARDGGRHVGTFGHVGCFSFYPTKNLGAVGDAGACVTNDTALAERMRRLRVYGTDEAGVALEDSTHSRLDELQAAMLQVKLRLLDDAVAQRRRIAQVYDEALKAGPVTPLDRSADADAFHLYVVRSSHRDRLRCRLAEVGIVTKAHYPLPAHRMPAFERFAGRRELPATEAACSQVLSLPLFPGIAPGQLQHVVNAVRDVPLL